MTTESTENTEPGPVRDLCELCASVVKILVDDAVAREIAGALAVLVTVVAFFVGQLEAVTARRSAAAGPRANRFGLAVGRTAVARGCIAVVNDYSYDSTLKSALGLNPKITAYVNGVLAWGCEPPPN